MKNPPRPLTLAPLFAAAVLLLCWPMRSGAAAPTKATQPVCEAAQLVSDINGAAYDFDTQLINPRGIASGTGGDLHVADQGVGEATVYTASGYLTGTDPNTAFLTTIPMETGTGSVSTTGTGMPTALVANPVPASGIASFEVPPPSGQGTNLPADYLIATGDGGIGGFSRSVNSGTSAVLVVNAGASGSTPQTFTITPQAGTGGTIDPSTAQTVAISGSATFTATSGTGYMVSEWDFNGGAVQTGGTSYTLSNVQTSGTLLVTFSTTGTSGSSEQSYAITPQAGSGGAIAPSGTQTVASGSSVMFTATPTSGYAVSNWYFNGGLVQTGGTTYTLSNVQDSGTLQVTFGATAAYTGLAISSGTVSGGAFPQPLLYAANFGQGTVDVFDTNYTLLSGTSLSGSSAFVDPYQSLPPASAGGQHWSPFNVRDLVYTVKDPATGKLVPVHRILVIYALRAGTSGVDVQSGQPSVTGTTATSFGYAQLFDTQGVVSGTAPFIGAVSGTASTAAQLDAPWGVAVAHAAIKPWKKYPAGSAPITILIANHGTGMINAYAFVPGQPAIFLGVLANDESLPLNFDGLWGLEFGPAKLTAAQRAAGQDKLKENDHALFFTAGLLQGRHGLMGRITIP